MIFFIIELIDYNSVLLDEKHELEYKFNKTNEISKQQICELETSLEILNEQLKIIKIEYDEKVDDLNKQIESMDNQIKLDKTFINVIIINFVLRKNFTKILNKESIK